MAARVSNLASYPLPDLFFVGSTRVYRCPGFGVGGIGSPFVTVTSRRVVLFRYCPDFGAVLPGFKPAMRSSPPFFWF